LFYGANGAALAVNGTGISTGTTGSGWYILSANTKTLSYSLTQYMIGLIGDATPNGWNSPDQKMDYNYKTGLWYITLNLTVGSVKVRSNDAWGSINLGLEMQHILSILLPISGTMKQSEYSDCSGRKLYRNGIHRKYHL